MAAFASQHTDKTRRKYTYCIFKKGLMDDLHSLLTFNILVFLTFNILAFLTFNILAFLTFNILVFLTPRILIFSIAMGADYSFEVKIIEIWVPAFFKHNNSSLATVVNKGQVLCKMSTIVQGVAGQNWVIYGLRNY